MSTLKAIIFALLIFPTACLLAQQDSQEQLDKALETSIGIIGRGYNNAIQLRWGPGQPAVWELGLEQGYVVERAEVTNTNSPVENLSYRPLPGSPFRPWAKEKWKEYFDTHPDDTKELRLMAVAFFSNFGERNEDENALPPAFEDGLNSLQENKSQADNQFGFSMLAADRSSEVAKALGLSFTDQNIVQGKTYAYRVRLNGNSPIYQVEPGYWVQKAENFDPQQFAREMAVEEKDQAVFLSWEKPDGVLSHTISRAGSRSGPYRPLHDAPFVNSTPGQGAASGGAYLDQDGLENYRWYYYRIHGHTAFGDSLLLGEVRAMPRDRTPPGKPSIKSPEHIEKEVVLVNWDMQAPIAKDLLGFQVSRGSGIEGPFSPTHQGLLSPEERSFRDSGFEKEGRNYYLVEAVDTAGNRSRSNAAYVTLIDSVPPARPVILKGVMDSLGIVTLELQPNTEKDLMGYRLLKSNAEYHEYSVFFETYAYDNDSLAKATLIRDTSTLNTLTKAAYYRAVALDYHYNASPMSEPFKVVRPDTIRPVSPVFRDYRVRQDTVELVFYPSASGDVEKHILYRRREFNYKWSPLVELGPRDLVYVDTTVAPNTVYEYALKAVDENQLESEMSRSIIARPYKRNIVPPVASLTAKLDEDKQQASLSWSYNARGLQDYFFVVYRNINGKGLRSVAKVRKDEPLEYVDRRIDKNVPRYGYRVKVFSTVGESQPSEEVVVVRRK